MSGYKPETKAGTQKALSSRASNAPAQNRIHSGHNRIHSGDIHIDHVAPKYALSAVAMSLVSVTTICIYGHPWAAAIVGGLEIGGIIGLFLRGSRKHKQLEGRTDKPTQ